MNIPEARKMVVEGHEIGILLKNGPNLRAAINKVRGKPDMPGLNLRALLAQARHESANGMGLRRLYGLGGVAGLGLLTAAENQTNAQGNYDASIQVEQSMVGQITDFTYDEQHGTGTLKVNTLVTTKVAGQAISDVHWYWDIRIEPQGFTSIKKDENNSNYFGPPNTIPFTQAMKDNVDARGFMYKLWASGGKIRIVKLLKGTQLITHQSPKPDRFLILKQPGNCIDLLTIAKLQTGDRIDKIGDYCLGRYKNPMIVNTGY